jgi:hypothetical protein
MDKKMNNFQFFVAVVLGVVFCLFVLNKIYAAYFGECAECNAEEVRPPSVPAPPPQAPKDVEVCDDE